MTELTELENHRRMITAQIKREVEATKQELRKEYQSKYDNLDSRLQEQQKAINVITHRLMDLSLYENKLILQSEKVAKLITAGIFVSEPEQESVSTEDHEKPHNDSPFE